MFSKDDVGKRVIGEEFGIGVITHFGTDERDLYPVRVNFKNGDGYFRANGMCCTHTIPSKWDIKLLDEVTESTPTQVIVDGKIVALTPEILARVFWNLDSSEQARFYNHLDTVADFNFPFQLQWITEEDGLTLAGRRVMGCIGEYSHWGLVPKLRYNGEIK